MAVSMESSGTLLKMYGSTGIVPALTVELPTNFHK